MGEAFNPDALFERCRLDDLPGFEHLLRLDDRCFEKSRHDGVTAAHVAAQFGALRVLERILTLDRAAAELRDEKGFSPLLRAADFGQLEAVKLVAKHSSEAVMDRDDYGFTALHRATRGGHLPVCEWLVRHRPELIHCENNNGEHALFHACATGEKSVAALLLDHGAHVNARNVFRSNCLFPAIEAAGEGFGHALGVVELLLERGVDGNCRNELKQTPLCLSIDLRCFPALVLLLQHECDPDLPRETHERFRLPSLSRFAKPDSASPLTLALVLHDLALIEAFELGLGKSAVQLRMCELSSALDPHDLVGRHLLADNERWFCVDSKRQWLGVLGELLHVLRSIDTGKEVTMLLKRGGNAGIPFQVLPDSAFPYPLLRFDEQPQNILTGGG